MPQPHSRLIAVIASVVVLVCLALPEEGIAQSAAPVKFKLRGSETVSSLTKDRRGEFEGSLQGVGAVAHTDGVFHLLFNDIQGGWPPSEILVGYATSTNGLIFIPDSDEGVFRSADVPYLDDDRILANSLVEEDDGSWSLYFDAVNAKVIGRAAAPTLSGPWRADPEPALEPGVGTWDQLGLVAPNVVKTEDGYFLYYGAFGASEGNAPMSIGLATSDDGVSWVKHADPVLEPGPDGAWDAFKVEVPRVVVTDDGTWVMAYRSDDGHSSWGSNSAYGLAVSSDGINWSRLQDEPVIHENDLTWATVWSSALLYQGDKFHLYLETDGFPTVGTRINVVTYDGPIATATEDLGQLPGTIRIESTYPNPFSRSTEVTFRLDEPGYARVTAHDLMGRQVDLLADGIMPARSGRLAWDASDLPAGVYFIRLETPSGVEGLVVHEIHG